MTNAVYKIKELLNLPFDFDKENREITSKLTKENCVRYAVFAAEEVLPLFEKENPKDKRPREAIEATKEWLKSPTEENGERSRIAGDRVFQNSHFAYLSATARFAADAAAYAAITTTSRYATYVAANAAHNADPYNQNLQYKIIDYGRKLLREQK